MTGEVVATLVVFSMIILAGVSLMIAAMFNRRGLREMEHRERLAMIERGLMPSPESDPGGFESAAGFKSIGESPAGVRYRTAGVLMIGFGFALLMLISFSAHDAATGFGVGGSFAVLGAASTAQQSSLDPSGAAARSAHERRTVTPRSIGRWRANVWGSIHTDCRC